jgi:hypothetical protein
LKGGGEECEVRRGLEVRGGGENREVKGWGERREVGGGRREVGSDELAVRSEK